MPKQTKADKDLAAAMALMAQAAAEVGVDLGEVKPVDTYFEAEVKEHKLREADGVLVSLTYPQRMMTKICKGCEQPFQTNYRGVGCCSPACRRGWFNRTVGIDWDFSRQNVWGDYEPPLVISAETFKMMETWANAFLSQADEIKSRVQEPENPPTFDPDSLDFEFEGESEPVAQVEPEPEILESDRSLTSTQPLTSPQSTLDILDSLDFDF